jgi:hypothetical protein
VRNRYEERPPFYTRYGGKGRRCGIQPAQKRVMRISALSICRALGEMCRIRREKKRKKEWVEEGSRFPFSLPTNGYSGSIYAEKVVRIVKK